MSTFPKVTSRFINNFHSWETPMTNMTPAMIARLQSYANHRLVEAGLSSVAEGWQTEFVSVQDSSNVGLTTQRYAVRWMNDKKTCLELGGISLSLNAEGKPAWPTTDEGFTVTEKIKTK